MATRNVSIDFNQDFGGEAPRIYVSNLDQADTVIATWVAPPEDPKFRLGITHQSGFPECQRRAVLTDATGKVVYDWQASAFDYRFSTKSPPARGFNQALIGGMEYRLTVTQTDQDPNRRIKRADFQFDVNT